jgi:hypothetical protein
MRHRIIVRRGPAELVAERGGRPLAVVSIDDGRVLAEPIDRSAEAIRLLRRRRAELLA